MESKFEKRDLIKINVHCVFIRTFFLIKSEQILVLIFARMWQQYEMKCFCLELLSCCVIHISYVQYTEQYHPHTFLCYGTLRLYNPFTYTLLNNFTQIFSIYSTATLYTWPGHRKNVSGKAYYVVFSWGVVNFIFV